MSRALSQLAEFLQEHQAAIVQQWEEACAGDGELGRVRALTRAEFRNNIPAAIEQLCHVIRCGAEDDLVGSVEEEVAKHGHHRWKQGFDLQQLIRDWGHLNRILVRTIQQFFRERGLLASEEQQIAMDRLATFMTVATASSVRRFDDLRRAEAKSLSHDVEEAKRRFERITRARGQLLREAAHDIRGGLTAIAGASAVIKLDPNQSLSELLDVLDRGVDSVLKMLDSLLELSRLEAGAEELELVTVDVAELLEDLAAENRATATAKGLALNASGPQQVLVRTDPTKVRRITQNLLVNALQHTTAGEVNLSWEVGPRNWKLQVTDTGPGIQDAKGSPLAREINHPDCDRRHPIESGSQVHAGEGIGLTIVKRLCDLMDASVSLDSEAGRGTCFTCEFPLQPPPKASEET